MVRRTKYKLVMLGLTATYLVCELGFNARLLDVVGAEAGASDIVSIERWGRVISGIALTLALWGIVLTPLAARFDRIHTAILPLAFGTALICMSSAWTLEKRLVDSIVDKSSGQMRRTAIQLRLVSDAALKGKLPIDGIELGGRDSRDPAAKAFLAIFADFALSYPRIGATLDELMRDPEMLAATAGSATLAPLADNIWRKSFVPTFASVKESYDRIYVVGSSEYRQAIDGIPARQDDAWSKYIDQLKGYGYTPENAQAIASSVVSALHDNDVMVPEDWDPGDRAAFDAAVAAKVRKKADASFADRSREVIGAAVSPGLSWDQFCGLTEVQQFLRSKLNLEPTTAISCTMTFDEFAANVFPAISRQNPKLLGDELTRPAADFDDGASGSQFGKEAVAAVVVPAIALGLSLLGAIVHVYKTGSYIVASALPDIEWPELLVRGAVIALVFVPLGQKNEITNSATYEKLEKRKEKDGAFGPAIATGFRWVIQSEPYFYPINEFIRRQILEGYKFDDFPDGDEKGA